jgi:parallel beta-helix repeat protein
MKCRKTKTRRPLPVRIGAPLIGLALLAPLTVSAATITVTSNRDVASAGNPANCPGASCGLRDAIAKAVNGDIINFNLPAGSTAITLLLGQLELSTNLSIDASGTSGGVTVDGNKNDRVFHVDANVAATFTSLTIQNGNTGGDGGGIYIDAGGNLALINSKVTGNTAGGFGGGIENYGGTLALTNSAVSNNQAKTNFGGIDNWHGATATLSNSTLSGNTATGYTGGIYNGYDSALTLSGCTISGNTGNQGGGIYNGGLLTLSNSTVTGNTAPDNGAGGIDQDEYYGPSTLTLINVTLAGNAGGDLGSYFQSVGNARLINTLVGACTTDMTGHVTDNGGNLDGGDNCGFTAATSKSRATLNLGALADNGGPTRTLMPGANSDAVGRGLASTCKTAPASGVDQRGLLRSATACTSGAVEVGATASAPPLTPQALTAAWYDPVYTGSGFNVTMTDAGLLVYYYGWDQGGNRLWLSSDLGPKQILPGTSIMLNLVATNGGKFLTPAKPATQSAWGTAALNFSLDGSTATALLAGNDGAVNLNLRNLIGMTGTSSVTGAWYDPVYTGSGFNMVMTAQGLLSYYYGWDKNGHRLWLVADTGPKQIAAGTSATLNMIETNGGTFLAPAKPGAPPNGTNSTWGTLQLNFSSCKNATATLTGNDGTVTLNMVMLVGVLNMPPGC